MRAIGARKKIVGTAITYAIPKALAQDTRKFGPNPKLTVVMTNVTIDTIIAPITEEKTRWNFLGLGILFIQIRRAWGVVLKARPLGYNGRTNSKFLRH